MRYKNSWLRPRFN